MLNVAQNSPGRGEGGSRERWGLGTRKSAVDLCLSCHLGKAAGWKTHPGKTPLQNTESFRAKSLQRRGYFWGELREPTERSPLPLTETRLGRMVTEPSATSSRCRTGEILEPQLSEPIQMKCPVWFALLAASSTLLRREATGTGFVSGPREARMLARGRAQRCLHLLLRALSWHQAPRTTRRTWTHESKPHCSAPAPSILPSPGTQAASPNSFAYLLTGN